MRVAHIIKVIRVAGAEQHLLTLLAGLRERQVDARLLLLVEPGTPMDDYVRLLNERDIPVERLVIHHDADITLFSRLAQTLRTLQPDLVHTHLLHADLYGILVARLAGVTGIISGRHNDDDFRRRFPIWPVNWLLWRLVSAGVAISDALAQFSIQVEGAPPRKLWRIYYGVALTPPLIRVEAREVLEAELKLTHQSILVGLVCRLVEQKGVSYGLQAFARIAPEFPDAHLLIAGDGPLRGALESETAALGLTGRVHFLGWRTDVPVLMAALDVLLAPSLWEGFGLVLLEAMAQQTPIIGSAVSAIPEIVVDGETGLLCPPRDVDALTDALRLLLGDAPLRQHMGLVGRDRLETHFGAERMIAETVALYEELMPTRKARN